MKIESFAALKEYLKPGVRVTLQSAYFNYPPVKTNNLREDLNHKGLGEDRTVKSCNSYLLVFSDDSRLQWGEAKDITFINNWTTEGELITTGFRYDDIHRNEWGCRLVYFFPEELKRIESS